MRKLFDKIKMSQKINKFSYMWWVLETEADWGKLEDLLVHYFVR